MRKNHRQVSKPLDSASAAVATRLPGRQILSSPGSDGSISSRNSTAVAASTSTMALPMRR